MERRGVKEEAQRQVVDGQSKDDMARKMSMVHAWSCGHLFLLLTAVQAQHWPRSQK